MSRGEAGAQRAGDGQDEPSFHHAGPATAEHRWLSSPQWARCDVLDLRAVAAGHTRLVVASAHPDDETLAVGGLIADLASHGLPVLLVVVTAGEASHPDSTAWSPDQLSAVRAAEVDAAVQRLAPGAEVVHLNRPDGRLAQRENEMRDLLAEMLTPGDLLLAPWVDDGHPDHDALGLAAQRAAMVAGCTVRHYPVWLWHWSRPEDFPWDDCHVVEPSTAGHHAKRAALQCFPSQTQPIGPLPADQPVLTETVLSRARRLTEVLLRAPDLATPEAAVRESTPLPIKNHSSESQRRVDRFEAMFDSSNDPWRASSFYETRKRDLTVAMLGRPTYSRALEVGCSTGVLTRALAGRCAAVLAMDISSRALAQAQRGAPAGIVWRQGTAPDDLPDSEFDLIVVSEVGYFLTPVELLGTLSRCRDALAPGGELLLAHWRHPTQDIPLDGPLAHEQARTALDLPLRAQYADADVLLDVWGEPRSVAIPTAQTGTR